jgi:hypothetical protein
VSRKRPAESRKYQEINHVEKKQFVRHDDELGKPKGKISRTVRKIGWFLE